MLPERPDRGTFHPMNCLFCKIAHGDIPAQVVYEDVRAMAFRDIHPQSPVHVLVIPKSHVTNLLEMQDDNLSAHLLQVVQIVAKQEGLVEKGFRVVANVGEFGGQTVDHLHWHVLGGRHHGWPPG